MTVTHRAKVIVQAPARVKQTPQRPYLTPNVTPGNPYPTPGDSLQAIRKEVQEHNFVVHTSKLLQQPNAGPDIVDLDSNYCDHVRDEYCHCSTYGCKPHVPCMLNMYHACSELCSDLNKDKLHLVVCSCKWQHAPTVYACHVWLGKLSLLHVSGSFLSLCSGKSHLVDACIGCIQCNTAVKATKIAITQHVLAGMLLWFCAHCKSAVWLRRYRYRLCKCINTNTEIHTHSV